ncbi:MAG: methyltransferase domain-containing protein [Acidimicrobiia bacterium]
MATLGSRLEKAPVGGGVVAGLVTALCCGGLPLFASIGLGAGFAGLRLWRFLPALLVAGTMLIVGVNWLYYRSKAQHSPGRQFRRAMFVSAGVGLAVMTAGVWFFDWLETAVHDDVEHAFEEAGVEEESAATRTRGLFLAGAAFPAGLGLLAALPFPSGTTSPPKRRHRKESSPMESGDIKEVVKRRYGAFAETGGHREECCAMQASTSSFAVEHGLYSAEQLAVVPDGALDLSRGCGNPTGFAALAPGEAVVDFGCGGGIDVILAAHQVGSDGRVVGVDSAPPMIERAKENVAKAGLDDHVVDFRLADLAETGLPDGGADVVISNCVINLSPDKGAVYREAARILRPGGRLAISDVILSEPIAVELQARFASDWVGCMGGAVPEADYLQILRRAGFTDIEVVSQHHLADEELQAMSRCPGPNFTPPVAEDDLAAVEGKVVSIKFKARKGA